MWDFFHFCQGPSRLMISKCPLHLQSLWRLEPQYSFHLRVWEVPFIYQFKLSWKGYFYLKSKCSGSLIGVLRTRSGKWRVSARLEPLGVPKKESLLREVNAPPPCQVVLREYIWIDYYTNIRANQWKKILDPGKCTEYLRYDR